MTGGQEVKRSPMLHYDERQRLHWACQQFAHTRATRGWLGVEKWHLWLAGYIPQDKVPSASSSGKTGFHCVWSVAGLLIVHGVSLVTVIKVDMLYYLYSNLCCQTICWCGWDDKDRFNWFKSWTDSNLGSNIVLLGVVHVTDLHIKHEGVNWHHHSQTTHPIKKFISMNKFFVV